MRVMMKQKVEPNERYGYLPVADEVDASADASTRLLYWLLLHPFQSIEDIALALRWHPSSVYRRVRAVEKQGMVESAAYQCHRTKATIFYYLAPVGIRRIARLLGMSTYEVAAYWKQRDCDLLRWLPRLQSQHVLQQMINRFVEAWPRYNQHTERMSWRWSHEFQDPFFHEGRRGMYVADALLVISSDHASTSILFVLDPGYAALRDESVIRRRVARLWEFCVAYKQNFPAQKVPPIFILTPSEQNRGIWTQVIHDVELRKERQVFQGATVACAYDEALPPVGRLPWKRILDGELCDPFELLPSQWRHEGMLSRTLIPMLPYSVSRRKKRSVLKGRFMERSLAPSPPEKMNSSKKEFVALLGLRLLRQHLNLLNVIYQHPFLTCEEIAALLYVDRATVQRSLGELRRWKCVRGYERSDGIRFGLGLYGMRLIAASLCVEFGTIHD